MKYFYAALMAAALTACSPSETSIDSAKHDHSQAHESSMAVSNAALRPPLPGRSMAAAYFTLENKGAADRLVSVESPISERVEIHTHLNEDGVMKMRKLDGLDLAAGETAEFKPGGLHIMLFDVTLMDGETGAMLTLNFEQSGPVEVVASVMGRGEPEKEDHSGH